MNLGQIYLGMGRYDKAIEVLAAVRRRSQQWIERTEPAWGRCTGPRAATWSGGATHAGSGRSPEGDRRS